tara:strand:- start:19 stop:219 length:201 start_codon:yes stop_codon:yes gene_type:complete
MDAVLAELYTQAPAGLTVLELADATGERPNSVWKSLRGLMAEGWVKRHKGPSRIGRRRFIYEVIDE